MHMKQGSDLIPANTELERTLKSLRKTKRAENAAMAEEGHDQTEEQRTTARSVAPLSRPDPLRRIRTESGMPLKSLHHSKSYLCGSDYKIGQAHKHLHLTKSLYNEGIQAFSK